MHSVLTLLVAGSIQIADDLPRPVDYPQIVLSVTQALGMMHPAPAPGEPALTVRDIPFYYRRVSDVSVPEIPAPVTYDWRSPVFFDVP
jgi:hypothetical protein